ncbi:hypothetical protein Goshw_015210 [Gossypium schwendimanii]|uniref:RNase H type-1 domain-containing protein n=1 Tax=Gossypium schwendimanii TaxID=34291 RepID=A0A7J9KS80_GOSSC|nr:hypothetical protein [Gossypium schwendimanii]
MACGVYGYCSEDVLHVFSDCPAAWNIWNQIKISLLFKAHPGAIVISLRLPIVRNWVHLYMNGLVRNDASFAAIGGIVWDRSREWLFGFNRYLGRCSMFDVEVWGILDGLTLLLNRGYENVLIQSDCLEAIKVIQES